VRLTCQVSLLITFLITFTERAEGVAEADLAAYLWLAITRTPSTVARDLEENVGVNCHRSKNDYETEH
jgi:hypothetical protein